MTFRDDKRANDLDCVQMIHNDMHTNVTGETSLVFETLSR